MNNEIYKISFINELEKTARSREMQRIILQRKLDNYQAAQNKMQKENLIKKLTRKFIIKMLLKRLSHL